MPTRPASSADLLVAKTKGARLLVGPFCFAEMARLVFPPARSAPQCPLLSKSDRSAALPRSVAMCHLETKAGAAKQCCTAVCFLRSVQTCHRRWYPTSIQDFGLGPIGADVQRELVRRCRHPVRLLVDAGRPVLEIKRQRAIGVSLHRLALGSEREAIEFIRLEEMLPVVNGKRPETINRRSLPRGERDGVAMRAGQSPPVLVEIGINVSCFVGRVVVHVRLCCRGARQIVGAPARAVRRRGPAVADGVGRCCGTQTAA